MHVVVTGSSGRLGRIVAAELAASGHQVTGIDRTAARARGRRRTQRPTCAPRSPPSALLRRTAPRCRRASRRDRRAVQRPRAHDLRDEHTVVHTVIDAAVARRRPSRARRLEPDRPRLRLPGLARGPCPSTRRAAPPDERLRPLEARRRRPVACSPARPPGRFGLFRPCYVIAPDEWAGRPPAGPHDDRTPAAPSSPRSASSTTSTGATPPVRRRLARHHRPSTARDTSSPRPTPWRWAPSPSCGGPTPRHSASTPGRSSGTAAGCSPSTRPPAHGLETRTRLAHRTRRAGSPLTASRAP